MPSLPDLGIQPAMTGDVVRTPKLETFLDRVLPGWRNGFQPGVKPRQFQI